VISLADTPIPEWIGNAQQGRQSREMPWNGVVPHLFPQFVHMQSIGASDLAGLRVRGWMSQCGLDRALGCDAVELICIVYATLLAEQFCVFPMSGG
jgi:hypothetical protein